MSSTTTKNILLSQPKIGNGGDHTPTPLAHHVSEEDSATVVKIEIPGVDPSTVEVQCENNVLSVSCPRGQVTMPVEPTSDISKVKADIQWGLLTLRIPLPEAPQSRSIKVNIHDLVEKAEQKVAPKAHATEHRSSKASSKEFTSAT
jgi:HSP20 family molecular chaperone IbpA